MLNHLNYYNKQNKVNLIVMNFYNQDKKDYVVQ